VATLCLDVAGGLRVPMIPKATGRVLLVGQVEGEELD
jgi:hypothetical protein